MTSSSLARASVLLLLAACSSSSTADQSDAAHQAEIVGAMHSSLLIEIDALLASAKEIKAVAPAPTDSGWDETRDAAAIAAAKAAWTRARTAYEHIEGALAPIFPDLDGSLDGRYDDQLANLLPHQPMGDQALFDGEGVTGLHAVERILWSHAIPPHVVKFEQSLDGYRPPVYPANAAEATAFKEQLCAKMIADAQSLRDQWSTAVSPDIGEAFRGLVALMNEQREKVNKASTNEEESRYSQRTMADIRDNLEGTRHIYALFTPWVTSKNDPAKGAKGDGRAVDAKIVAGFGQLEATYGKTTGSAIPTPPPTWSAEAPSAQDLQTPFGELYSGVLTAVDPSTPGSVVDAMNDAARLLGIQEYKPAEEP